MTDSGSPLVPPRDGQLTPDAIAERNFAAAKRGYADSEVRAFLRRVADEFGALLSRERDLAFRVARLEEAADQPPAPLSDQELISALGEETARVLGQAREASLELRNKADEHARRVVREAQETARDLRATAQQALEVKTREAEDSARKRANEIVGEARILRERVLGDLADRRQELERQIAELRSSRGKLLDAYELVERALSQATKLMEHESPAVRATVAEPAAGDDEVDHPDAPADVPADAPVEAPEDADTESTADASPAAGSGAGGDPDDHEAEGREAEAKDVTALFDQLRSNADPDAAPGAAPVADVGEAVVVIEPTVEVDVVEVDVVEVEELEEVGDDPVDDDALTGDQALLRDRDVALADTADELNRRAKRALQDEQNDILDGVRRQRGKIDTSKVLPALDDQLARWAHVLQPAVDTAYAIGAATSGGTEDRAPAPVLADLSSVLVTPLRERLTSTLTSIDEPTPADTEIAIAQRLGARYREWRSQHLETMLGDVLAAAHARGAYDAAPEGSRLRWVPLQVGKCPDCDDNALEPTLRGNDFPTGQQYPPAHPGCRCLVVVDTDS